MLASLERLAEDNLPQLKRQGFYFLAFLLLFTLFGCSFPTSETKTPSPTTPQEILNTPTATFPASPTSTPRVLPPALVESKPAANAELPLDASLTYYFNQAMDHASVEAAFSGVNGSFEWVDDATVVVSPSAPLLPARKLNVQIDTQAKAANGLPMMETINLEYETVGYLNLAQSLPENGSVAVDPTTAIMATFNQPVVSLGGEVAAQPSALILEPSSSGHGEWLNTSTYIFYPEPSLEGGVEYTVQVNEDLKGLNGSPLQNRSAWSFITAQPRLLSIEPVDGSSNTDLDEPIRLTFNQPMDADGMAENFTMRDAEGTRLHGQFTWNDLATEFYFTPDYLLKRDQVYEVAVSEKTPSSGGTPLGSKHLSEFRTIPELAVVSSDPANNAQMEVYSSVAINFNAPIKASDVLNFITIQPQVPDLDAVVDQEGRTLWFNGFYAPETTYELIISPNLPDKWNGRLGNEYSLDFRTRPLSPSLLVSTSSDVIFLTPEESSISVQVTNIDSLSYSVGLVSLEDFKSLMGPNGYELRQSYKPESERPAVLMTDIPANQSTALDLPLSVDGGPLDPGLYALRFNLDLDYIYPGPYLLVVSDINTTLKLSATDALVWAVDLQDGESASGIQATIYSERGEILLQGITDSQGILQSDIPVRQLEDIYAVSYAILGEPGEDNFSAAVTNWGQGISGSNFGYQVDYSPPHLEAYLYTDRPIYRPGQTVYFRAVIRQAYNGRYSATDRTNLILNLVNDLGEQIATLNLHLSSFGTANSLYTLPEDIQPGYYRFISEEADFSSVVFQVADYRKPEINLSVVFPDEQTLAGDRVEATVLTRYFFDAPAANIPVKWTLYRTKESFLLQGYQVGKLDTRWMFGLPGIYTPDLLEQIDQGEGVTDMSGGLNFSISLPAADERFRYTLEATVQDESGLPISARSDLLVNPAEYFIGVRPDAMAGQAGSELGFEILTVDTKQQPSNERPLRADFQKVIWEEVEPQPGNARARMTFVPEYTPVSSADFITGADGKARLAFTPQDPGTYQLDVSGIDPGNANPVTQVLLWVGGPGQAIWPNLPNRQLRLTADKDSYLPDETAYVFVPNPFGEAAKALMTIERGVVIEHQILDPQGSGFEIAVPLKNEQAPNIYVSVTLLKPDGEGGFDFRQGYINLPVEAVEQTLNVTLSSEPMRVDPGGELALDLLVSDSNGEPIEGEFSLSVVDLATLALADPNSKEIVDAFYSDQPLGVSTSLSLAGSTKLRAVGTEGIGGGGGGEAAPPVQVREDFLDTAYWNPDLITDEEGHAQVRITLPDNVTTWQLDTRGVTPDTHVGQAEGLVVSTKDLLIRPVTPRFLVFGDHVVLAAIVNNNTSTSLDTDVSLQVSGFQLDDPQSTLQSAVIPAGGRQRIEWWGTVEDVESVDLLFSASAGELQDASRPSGGELPVLHYTAPQTFGTSGMMDEGGERLEVISLPRSFDPQGGELSLEMAPTLGAAMMSALQVLEYHPNANTEQLVSSFLPNVQTYKVIQDFGVDDPGLGERIDLTLENSLEQLYQHQNTDGGWGWWNNSQSDPYLTAYTILGLIDVQEAGVAIDPNVIDVAIDYQVASLVTPDMISETWQYDRLAFIHYVLSQAGLGDLSGVSRLYEERSRLNPWGKALLALAFDNIAPGDDRSLTLYSDLESSANRSSSGAHWEEQEEGWQNMSTTIQSSAVVLFAIANHDPASPLVADAVRYLMAHRGAQGAWSSSYETAWTLMALAEVMRSTGELSGDFDFSASVNDVPIIAGESAGSSQFTPVEAKTPVSALDADQPNSLLISRGDGTGRMYYNVHLSVHRPVEDVAPLDQGISISRAYYSTLDNCSTEECIPIDSTAQDEPVVVRLTLTIPETAYYLMVEDYIPAGTEILDTSLKTSQQGSIEARYALDEPFAEGWGWWYFNDPQIHDDRISWSVDSLPAGTYELTYQLIPLQSGEYRVLPARAWQLYFPEVQGNSAGEIFKINN